MAGIEVVCACGSGTLSGHVAERAHARMSSLGDNLCLSSFEDIGIVSSLGDRGKAMQIHTPLDLGLVIREKRRKLKVSQAELAGKVGVGRQWVVAIEHGKSRAELGLALRTLSALGLSLTIDSDDRQREPAGSLSLIDIDMVVNAATIDRK